MGLSRKDAVLLVFLVAIAVPLALYLAAQAPDNRPSATGKTTATVEFCVNTAPTITAIADQSAQVGQAFTVTINATDPDNSAIRFSDNTDLFDIGATTGLISFTPTTSGTFLIRITATDNSSCQNSNASANLTLTIAGEAAAPERVRRRDGAEVGPVPQPSPPSPPTAIVPPKPVPPVTPVIPPPVKPIPPVAEKPRAFVEELVTPAPAPTLVQRFARILPALLYFIAAIAVLSVLLAVLLVPSRAMVARRLAKTRSLIEQGAISKADVYMLGRVEPPLRKMWTKLRDTERDRQLLKDYFGLKANIARVHAATSPKELAIQYSAAAARYDTEAARVGGIQPKRR
ncbi:hypothetical protein HY642_02415 [Candidatus Woesearchaeota archaeon]|nr:hypothetical protein [Candidatus Woesearchaeota archaeon]